MADIKISQEVASILGQSRIDGMALHLPPGQLDRKIYLDVKKTIETLGGKWKTNLQAFLFDRDPAEKLNTALGKGVVVDTKKQRQAFYTPDEVASTVAMLADVEGCKVLEPSAGDGALVRACAKYGATTVDAIEVESECKEILEMIANSVIIGDFLAQTPSPIYDRVVMNPPFSKGQDVKHVLHALKWLKPDGLLFSIVIDKPHPKLESLGAIDVAKFDAGSFKPSGTNIATKLIRIEK
ncbi:MAG: hypothetical protein ACRC62_07985 [Microcoleus sp.]